LNKVHLELQQITAQRQQMAQELQESNERFLSLLTALPDIIFIFDEEGRYIEILTSENDLLYADLQELKGQLIHEVLPKESADLFFLTIQKTLETGKNQILEYQLEVPAGQIWFEGRTAPMKQRFNNKEAVVWIAKNISERKNLEVQLQQSQKIEALGTLAGGIAHDFNNILAIILTNTEILLMDLPPDFKGKQKLKNIEQVGERATNLIKQILTFSRMETTWLKPINISSVIQETLRLVRATIPVNIEIHQNFKENYSNILADVTQIQQIIVNLCTNAYHAIGDASGVIEVSLKEIKEDKLLKIMVSDTGCGIPQEDIDKIFDPFFTTKGVGKGTGLGLSVVHGIVENHQGKIKVESELGKGSTISLYFPTVETESSEAIVLEPILNKGTDGTRMRHILLVEDETEIAELYQDFLERLGYDVTLCSNGSDALTLFKEDPNQFDLVLTDQAMPHMTGKQLAKELFLIRPDMPVILTTGYSDALTEEEAKELGIRKYLMKPIKLKTLQQAIEEYLEKGTLS